MRIGVLRPEALQFAKLPEAPGASEAFADLVDVADVGRMYRSQPQFTAPSGMLEALRNVFRARPPAG